MLVTTEQVLKYCNMMTLKSYYIENFPCGDQFELESRERYYIENNKCVNRYRPTRTNKRYREENLDIIKDREHKYRVHNQEKVKHKIE